MRSLIVVFAVAASGCFNYIADTCPQCRTVRGEAPEGAEPHIPPPASSGLKARIVLVPGAFGFGDEWKPVLAAIAARKDLDSFVFDWRGPWKNPERSTRTLAHILQKTLDTLPPDTNTLVVFAHSAGGMIADLGVRYLRVPEGKHVLMYGLDGELKWRMKLPPERDPDGKRAQLDGTESSDFGPYPPIPVGVTITHYVCKNPKGAKKIQEDGGIEIRVGLNAGHNEMVAPAAVPLINAL